MINELYTDSTSSPFSDFKSKRNFSRYRFLYIKGERKKKSFRENSFRFLLQHFRQYLFRYIETNTIEKVVQHGKPFHRQPSLTSLCIIARIQA